MTGRDDVLGMMLTAGALLGFAQATKSVEEHFNRIAEVMALADGVQEYDPVAARVIRERANGVLHGETIIIDGTATDIPIPTRELESGE